MVESWLKTLSDKLKRETELEDRILALTALKITLGARKLLPPFDQIPARGKLNVREFMSRINLDELEEQAILAAPARKKKPKTAPATGIAPKTPLRRQRGALPDLANPLVKNDVLQVVVQNAGKAMNAICSEDMETLEEIPTVTDQVTTAIINSPNRSTAPVRYEFTPLEFHEPELEPNAARRLYQTLHDIDVDEDIEDMADEPDLDQSIYGFDDDDEEIFFMPPESVADQSEPSVSNQEEDMTGLESQFDPVTFAMDNPEFDFIPADLKAYIKRMVKKELIHWPPYLQDLGQNFNWPKHTETAELIQFSPMK